MQKAKKNLYLIKHVFLIIITFPISLQCGLTWSIVGLDQDLGKLGIFGKSQNGMEVEPSSQCSFQK